MALAQRSSRRVALLVRLGVAIGASILLLYLTSAIGAHPSAWIVVPIALLPLARPLVSRIPYAIGRFSVWVVIALFLLFCISYVAHVVDDYFAPLVGSAPHALHERTANGRPYTHDTMSLDMENGRPVWTNICEDELEAEWRRITTDSAATLAWRASPVRSTLVRYLTSLGLRKDSVAIARLRVEDVLAIQAGIPNYRLHGRWRVYRYIWRELQLIDRRMRGDSVALMPFGSLAAASVSAWRCAQWGIPDTAKCAPAHEGEAVALLSLVHHWGLLITCLAIALVWGTGGVLYHFTRQEIYLLLPYWACLVCMGMPLRGIVFAFLPIGLFSLLQYRVCLRHSIKAD